MKRVFSGVQPSGRLHIGNYIGALQQWAKIQDDFENFFCIVDMHAITVQQDPKLLKKKTREIAAWYLASGINPKKSTIFIQSHNKDHAQLAWILNCYTSVGQLNRMTQYKDKKTRQDFVSAGLYDYPVLMAADILLYSANLVPVGEDQKQHVELARDVAERFNGIYDNLFTVPEYMAPPTGERIMSLQDPKKKMSKSINDPLGTINLDDEPDIIRKKIKSAMTDSGNEITIKKDKPAVSNLVKIFMAVSGRSAEDIGESYSGKGYKIFKEELGEAVVNQLSVIQAAYKKYSESKELTFILKEGLMRAEGVSHLMIRRIEEAVGLG